MTEIGYTLSSEEHLPNDLVAFARRAEEAGFTFALISDHFHPWTDSQGQSPFVWSVLGGVAQVTERLRIGTGVTCPLIRMHPAIVAQAAATVGCMMPGRFFLGVGTGENLNEHITGQRWPAIAERLEMLEEAVEVIRRLWEGGYQHHRGRHYHVENARIYTLPDPLPKIHVAASGPSSAHLAGRIGDGLISVAPNETVVENFEEAGGNGKPRYAQVHVCYATDEAEAVRTAHEWWPNTGLPGQLGQELAIPKYFEQAAQLVTPDHIRENVVCGPDVERYVEAVREYVDAGFDHVYLHQIGPDQEAFLDFSEHELLPKLR